MKFAFQDCNTFHQQRNHSIERVFSTSFSLAKYLDLEISYTKQMCEVISAVLLVDLGFDGEFYFLLSKIDCLSGFLRSYKSSFNTR